MLAHRPFGMRNASPQSSQLRDGGWVGQNGVLLLLLKGKLGSRTEVASWTCAKIAVCSPIVASILFSFSNSTIEAASSLINSQPTLYETGKRVRHWYKRRSFIYTFHTMLDAR